MTSATTHPALASLRSEAARVEPADFCPAISPTLTFIESEKEKRPENMADAELVSHVEIRLRSVGKELRSLIPYLLEARRRYAHAGRRIAVHGEPTFTEWIRKNIGVSDRHVRRLLAAAKEPSFRSGDDEAAANSKQEKRDEVLWQANRLAHSVLGLEEPDERDPSGVQRKAALTAMAYQFLRSAHRKPIPMIVRAKPLQPADVRGLCRIILMCFEMQVDDVFRSLGDEERRDAVRLLGDQIADRYNAQG